MKLALAVLALVPALATGCGTAGLTGAADGPPSTAPRWSPAARIDETARDDIGALLAVSASGRVIAVLTESNAGRGIVSRLRQRSSRYSSATGWITDDRLPFDFSSSVVIDDEGTARAVGTVGVTEARGGDSVQRVWSSRSRPGAPWTVPEIVPGPGLDAYRPTTVCIDPALELAIWVALGRAPSSLWASVRDGIGWMPAQQLSAEGDGVSTPTVAANGRGQALVVWPATRGASHPLLARTFDRASGWSEGERIGSSALEAVLAFVGSHALALWTSPDGLFMSARREDGSWTPEGFGPSRGDRVSGPRLAMDGSGRAVAIWQESDQQGGYPLFGAAYDTREGWKAARLLAVLGSSERGGHEVVLDGAGRGVATWSTNGRLCGLTYDGEAGWSPAAECFGSGPHATVATDEAGHVMATWADQGATWYSTLDLGRR